MNKLSWIFIGSTLFIIAMLSIFVLRPLALNGWQIYNDNKATKTELENVGKKKEILTTLSKNNQLDNLYTIASKYIPVDQNSSELVIEMSAIANQANLKVEQFSLDNAAPKQDTTSDDSSATTTSTGTTQSKASVNELKFSMKLSGSFTDFLTFLKNSETSSRLITFSSVALSTNNGTLSAQLSGSAYWKKDSQAEGNLDNVAVSQATIDKFQNLKSYGTPINLPAESGFGRTNPFDAIN